MTTELCLKNWTYCKNSGDTDGASYWWGRALLANILSKKTTQRNASKEGEMGIDYTNEEVITRQNSTPNAGCIIDGEFYDIRNLLAELQAERELADRLALNLDHANEILRLNGFDPHKEVIEEHAARRAK